MKQLLLILSITLALYSCKSTSKISNALVEDIKATITSNLLEQKKAWNKGDIDGFMKHYWENDSMAFMSKSGIRYGWQATKESYKKGYPTRKEMGELIFKVKSLDVVSKDYAYMMGSWFLKRDTLDIGGHFSLVWKLIDKNWVIVSDHTS